MMWGRQRVAPEEGDLREDLLRIQRGQQTLSVVRTLANSQLLDGARR